MHKRRCRKQRGTTSSALIAEGYAYIPRRLNCVAVKWNELYVPYRFFKRHGFYVGRHKCNHAAELLLFSEPDSGGSETQRKKPVESRGRTPALQMAQNK